MSSENQPSESSVAAPAAWPVPGEADYEAICAAVMETDRGRWFLAEYARRNRNADTAAVLAAIERIAVMAPRDSGPEAAVPAAGKPPGEAGIDIARLRAELSDMANAIARTKTEIAGIKPDAAPGGRILEATEQLDSVVRAIEQATSEILATAEQVQEVAWTMREQGMEPQFCDRLDGYATEIYTACSFQDLTGQRTRKIIHVLRYLEARILAMTGIWDATLPAAPASGQDAASPVPAAQSEPLVQNDVDRVMAVSVAASAVQSPTADTCEPSAAIGEMVPAAVVVPAATPAAPVTESKDPTLTIEGPKGSFSIMPAQAVEPPVPEPAASESPPGPDSVSADIRAFTSDLAAECETDGAPAAAASAAPAAAAMASPDEMHETGEADLPLAAAPALGDMAQRPTPEAPPRKIDITESLFADVMALSAEERIALFT
jgi:hypothetical protein